MTDHKKIGFSLEDYISKARQTRCQQDTERKAKIDALFGIGTGTGTGTGSGSGSGSGVQEKMDASMNTFNEAQGKQAELQASAERAVGSFLSGYVSSRGLKLGSDALSEIQALAAAKIPFVSNLAQGFLDSNSFSAFDISGKMFEAKVQVTKEKSKSAKRRSPFKVIEGGRTKKGEGEGEGMGKGEKR